MALSKGRFGASPAFGTIRILYTSASQRMGEMVESADPSLTAGRRVCMSRVWWTDAVGDMVDTSGLFFLPPSNLPRCESKDFVLKIEKLWWPGKEDDRLGFAPRSELLFHAGRIGFFRIFDLSGCWDASSGGGIARRICFRLSASVQAAMSFSVKPCSCHFFRRISSTRFIRSSSSPSMMTSSGFSKSIRQVWHRVFAVASWICHFFHHAVDFNDGEIANFSFAGTGRLCARSRDSTRCSGFMALHQENLPALLITLPIFGGRLSFPDSSFAFESISINIVLDFRRNHLDMLRVFLPHNG